MTVKEQAIELIAGVLSEVKRGNVGVFEATDELLALRYPCQKCEGSGKVAILKPNYHIDICPDCKGTGKGEKVLLIRADDQTPPENTCSTMKGRTGFSPHDFYAQAHIDHKKERWVKVVE